MNDGRKSIVIYGPKGCGKTRAAYTLARHFGMSAILDDWKPGQRIPLTDTLVLTSSDRREFDPANEMRRAIPFEDAMAQLRKPRSRP